MEVKGGPRWARGGEGGDGSPANWIARPVGGTHTACLVPSQHDGNGHRSKSHNQAVKRPDGRGPRNGSSEMVRSLKPPNVGKET